MGFQSWWISESSILLLQLLVRPGQGAGMQGRRRHDNKDGRHMHTACEVFDDVHVWSLIQIYIIVIIYVHVHKMLHANLFHWWCRPVFLALHYQSFKLDVKFWYNYFSWLLAMHIKGSWNWLAGGFLASLPVQEWWMNMLNKYLTLR